MCNLAGFYLISHNYSVVVTVVLVLAVGKLSMTYEAIRRMRVLRI